MRNDLSVTFEELDFNDYFVNFDRILPNENGLDAGGYIRIKNDPDQRLHISIMNMAGDCIGDLTIPVSDMIGGE